MSSESTFAGKRALVTGAGKRVGRAIALALGRSGFDVAVHYRDSADGAEQTCSEIRASGGRALSLRANLLSRDEARRLVDDSVAALGGLDLLVASAANFGKVAYADIDDRAWDEALDLNLTSAFVLAHRASPALKSSGGSIVFITCSSATTPFRNYLPYVVSKGALRQLARTLALELAPEVRVNAVAPGTVLPPDSMAPHELERIRRRIPLDHFGRPEDIADAVLFLSRSPFITGQEIVVDGGRSVAGFERFG